MLAESSPESPLKANLVLEGGGVKGIALVGAVAALEEEFERRRVMKEKPPEYWAFGRLVGTSAGAIVAALLGAGYSSTELSEIIAGEEIGRFADLSGIARIPMVGRPLDMGLGLLLRLGMFKGDYFLGFIRELLQAKGIRTFRDLIDKPEERDTAEKYRVRMIASDITRGRMLLLPDDMNIQQYGVSPDDLEVAEAVRMSISVPFVFRPVKLTGLNGVTSYIVDGGLLSNFPVGFFDGVERQRGTVATIGIKLVRNRYHDIKFPFLAARAAYALGSTALEAHDTSATEKFDRVKSNQTVNINTEAVSILRFNLSPLLREVLYSQGYSEMKNVVVRTDFLDRAVEAADAAKEATEVAEEAGLPTAA